LHARGQFGPKFQVQGVAPYQPFFLSENRMIGLFIWHKEIGRSFFRFITMHSFDGQTKRQKTDGQTHFDKKRPCACIHWPRFGQKWKTGTGRQYFTDIRSITTVTKSACKAKNSVKKTQNKGYYAVQGHSTLSRSVVPIASPYATSY